jgi:hypothetical protein
MLCFDDVTQVFIEVSRFWKVYFEAVGQEERRDIGCTDPQRLAKPLTYQQ